MLETLRHLLTSNISLLFPPVHADLVAGVILGIDSFPPHFYEALKISGLVHVVVVSGYNISVVTRVLLTAFKQLPLKFRISGTLIFVLLYVLLTGASAPTIRSALMAFLALTAQLLGKPTWGLYSLGLSALFMLLVDPSLIGSISFQLTFAATLGIILFEESFFKTLRWPLPSLLRRDLTTSLAAQVFVVPIILYNFGTISLISPVANMLTLWTVPLITYLGFFVLAVSLISLPLASLLSWALYLCTAIFIGLTELFSRVPYASVTLGRYDSSLALGVAFISLGIALFVRSYYGKSQIPTERNDSQQLGYSSSPSA